MIATVVNALAVILGAVLGFLFKNHISESFKKIVMTAAGLVTLILGIDMAFDAPNVIIMLFALLFGGFIGTALKIEERVEGLGNHFAKDDDSGSFGLGFLNSSLLFCSGAMSIVGSIQAGTTGDYNLIFIKSIMDGFMAIVFASTYGKGVFLSALTILVYQGFFTIVGGYLEPILGTSGINSMAAVGGYLLIMIALGLLEIKKVKTGNFLPALIIAPILQIIVDKI